MKTKNISAIASYFLAAGFVLAGSISMETLSLSSTYAQAPPRQNTPAKPPAPAAAAPVTPSSNDPQSAQPVRIETIVYDAWTLSCRDNTEKAQKKSCSAQMRVVEQNKQSAILAWVIGRDAQGALRTVIQTPTGVQIAKGAELKFGSGKSFILPYITCDAQRCESGSEMDDDFLREAEAATATTVTIVSSDGRAVTFSFSVKSIDKVLAAMASTR